jgi:hypothetical protein
MRTGRIVDLWATAFVTVVVLAAGTSASGRIAFKAGNVSERRVRDGAATVGVAGLHG